MNIEEKYQQSLDYLYSYIDYSLTRSFRYSPEKFDLKRMEILLEKLGNPHEKYKIIHIAGTKGKGSTAAFIETILRTAGYKTGLYTSPHMIDFRERIRLCGEKVPKREFVGLVEKIKPIAENIERITTFELTTAIGFLFFANMNVDVAVVEVGMGGRLDATNVVTPLVSVITQISYDHTDILGKTLNAIAHEKGGIIKNNIPTVLAPQKELAYEELINITKIRNSSVTNVGDDYRFSSYKRSLDCQIINLWSVKDQLKMNAFLTDPQKSNWKPIQAKLPLLGYHQIVNAATAYSAIQVIRKFAIQVTDRDILEGFNNTSWPGRFEVIKKDPPLIIDSAHNPESALMLRLTIEDYLKVVPAILLFGASEDKDVHGMLEYLIPRMDEIVVTESTHPRMMKAQEVYKICQQLGGKAKCLPHIEDAYDYCREKAGNEKAIIVGGSIFVAAAMKELWEDANNIKTVEDR